MPFYPTFSFPGFFIEINQCLGQLFRRLLRDQKACFSMDHGIGYPTSVDPNSRQSKGRCLNKSHAETLMGNARVHHAEGITKTSAFRRRDISCLRNIAMNRDFLSFQALLQVLQQFPVVAISTDDITIGYFLLIIIFRARKYNLIALAVNQPADRHRL